MGAFMGMPPMRAALRCWCCWRSFCSRTSLRSARATKTGLLRIILPFISVTARVADSTLEKHEAKAAGLSQNLAILSDGGRLGPLDGLTHDASGRDCSKFGKFLDEDVLVHSLIKLLDEEVGALELVQALLLEGVKLLGELAPLAFFCALQTAILSIRGPSGSSATSSVSGF